VLGDANAKDGYKLRDTAHGGFDGERGNLEEVSTEKSGCFERLFTREG
jgi:hypothetical protein